MAAATPVGASTVRSGCVAAEAGRSGTTSFQRRGKAAGAAGGGPRLVSIAGTRPSVRNGQLLVSTGLPALDQLLGRFRMKMWEHSRENLGRDSRGTPSPFTSMLRIACSETESKTGGRKLAWRCLRSCALNPP